MTGKLSFLLIVRLSNRYLGTWQGWENTSITCDVEMRIMSCFLTLTDPINRPFSCAESNHRRCSVRNGVLRNFAKFTGKHPVPVSFLIKLQTLGLNFAKFLRTLFFYRTTLGDCFWCACHIWYAWILWNFGLLFTLWLNCCEYCLESSPKFQVQVSVHK